jgi:hypothetical protein
MSIVSAEKYSGETEEDVEKSSSEHEKNKLIMAIIKKAYFTFIHSLT